MNVARVYLKHVITTLGYVRESVMENVELIIVEEKGKSIVCQLHIDVGIPREDLGTVRWSKL